MKLVQTSHRLDEARGEKRPSAEGSRDDSGIDTQKTLFLNRRNVLQGGMSAETEYSSIVTSGALHNCAVDGRKKPPVSMKARRNSSAGAVAGDEAVAAAQ
jgi:hypothetical protein